MSGQDVEGLFRAKHRLDRASARRLDAVDLEAVGQMALGSRPAPNRGRAMEILVTARAAAAHQVLARVLQNPDEEDALRAVAAGYLGRLGGPRAEEALLAALPAAAPPIVRLKVADALSQAGGTGSQDALRSLSDDPDEALRRQARLGLAVIAYRDAAGEYDLPVAGPGDLLTLSPDASTAAEIGPVPSEDLAALDEWFGDRPYGLRLSPDHVYQIICTGNRLALAFNAAEARDNLAARLRGQRMLLALVAARSHEDGGYSTQWVLFSWPAGRDTFHLAAYRGDGTHILFGSGTSSGDVAEFNLAAVRTAGNTPVVANGRFERSALVLGTTLSGTVWEGQRTPFRVPHGST